MAREASESAEARAKEEAARKELEMKQRFLDDKIAKVKEEFEERQRKI